MATVKPIPNPSVPMVDSDGRITQAWFEYFRSRETAGLVNLSVVSAAAIANGEVLIWNSTTLKFEPGAN